MEELKTCPFCGGKARQSYAGAKHIIICPNCVKLPADGGYIDSKDAVTAWNTRQDNCQNCTEVKAEHEMYLRVCEVVSVQKRLIDKLKNCRKAKGSE